MNEFLSLLSAFCGITYFLAWSASFYPQVWLNYKRKSVVGLSFDYLNYNILGFTCYSIYNVSLYWVPVVIAQYEDKYGVDHTPVQLSDVLFAVHALALCSVQCVQCFIFERGTQHISPVAAVLAVLGWVSVYVYALLGGFHIVTWLSFVYWLSYVKLFVTFVKYIPQVRSISAHWSLHGLKQSSRHSSTTKGRVPLDGTLAMCFLISQVVSSLSYRWWWTALTKVWPSCAQTALFLTSCKGDWTAFTNYSKLGLSFFSIGFDLLFIVQHYVCYPQPKTSPTPEPPADREISWDTDSENSQPLKYGSKASVNSKTSINSEPEVKYTV